MNKLIQERKKGGKGQGVQVIYGPTVPNIKSNLEEFLETPEADNPSQRSEERGV